MLKLQRQKIPEEVGISLENHFSPTENSKKTIFLNGKPLKKQKIEGKSFSEFFQNMFEKIF